ncbi:MAG: CCA tRNA nucleotidyltransferase [Deltaproteobacteria bacterium]
MTHLRTGADEVAAVLRDAGYEAFFAGGCVRDTILGVEPKDYDIVTNATPKQVSKLFRRTVQVGAAFGVVKVLWPRDREYEVATYREDGDYSDGRRPDAVSYSQSKIEDVKRRDFTINGLLMDPRTDEILDYVGGRDDLDRRVVRAVGDPAQRFAEDRLRMLRAVRFAVRFGLEIEDATLAAIRANAAHITTVSAERINQELTGIFRSARPGDGVRMLASTTLLPHVLPFVRDASGAAFDRFAEARGPLDEDVRDVVAWALVSVDSAAIEDDLRALKLSRDQIRGAMTLHAQAARLRDAATASAADVVRIAADEDVERLRVFLVSANASAALGRLDAAVAAIAADPLPARPMLTGADLKAMGMAPGPHFKDLLRAVDDAVLERRIVDREGALAMVKT